MSKQKKVHKWDSWTTGQIQRGIRCMKQLDLQKEWLASLKAERSSVWSKVTCKDCLSYYKPRLFRRKKHE